MNAKMKNVNTNEIVEIIDIVVDKTNGLNVRNILFKFENDDELLAMDFRNFFMEYKAI